MRRVDHSWPESVELTTEQDFTYDTKKVVVFYAASTASSQARAEVTAKVHFRACLATHDLHEPGAGHCGAG